MHSPRRQFARPARRGMLAPALAVAMLAIGCCIALMVNRLWFDSAKRELQISAEAAALAAAGRLADDPRINPNIDPRDLCEAARQAAAAAARETAVGGQRLLLDTSVDGDVRFGQLVRNHVGKVQFLETDYYPTSVGIVASRSRGVGNPVADLFADPNGHNTHDASVFVEATINNRILGVRPFKGGPAPALPLAILDNDPSGQRTDAWTLQIEQRRGGDRYSYDAATRQIKEEPDGLNEIDLHFMPAGGKPADANVQLVDLGTGLREGDLARQVGSGWLADDLADFYGELRTDGKPVKLSSTATAADPVMEQLRQMVGQKRIVLLYSGLTGASGAKGSLNVTRLAAGRIMALKQADDGTPVITLQAAVVATRTALVLDPDGTANDDTEFSNPYVYKISLTQ